MYDDVLLALFEKNYKFYFSIVFRVVKNIEDTEDILHNAFLKAYEADKSNMQDDELKRWFVTICKNTALTLIRKRRNDANRELQYVHEENQYDNAENDTVIKMAVEEQLKSIPTELLPCFREYIFGDISMREVCRKYGIPRDKMRYWKKHLEKIIKNIL